MDGYTVAELARLAGVSVRTLHHYDRIGLLKPDARTGTGGYRRYGRAKLLRLQQILFYREMDVPLAEIGRILDDPSFDAVGALMEHRAVLEARLGRLHRLVDTLDRTVEQYRGGAMLTDDELYAGFPREKVEEIRREARERWGEERVTASEQAARSLTKGEWQATQAEGEAIAEGLSKLRGRAPTDTAVQSLVARHYAWVARFWKPDADAYRGLGEMYVQDERFRDYYDRWGAGTAELLRDGMSHYAGTL